MYSWLVFFTSLTLLRHNHYWGSAFVFLPPCLLIPAAFAMKSSRVFCFVLRIVAFDIAACFHRIQSRTYLFIFLQNKTKENQSNAARSLPVIEIVCVLGCALLSSSTLCRHVGTISAALLFCSIFLFCFPPYFLWSLVQFHFLLPPVSIVFEPGLLLFQPWAKEKKINQASTPGHCQLLSC